MIVTKVYKSPIGDLLIGSIGDKLCLCDWIDSRHFQSVASRIKRICKTEIETDDSPVIELTINQLNEYFYGDRSSFKIPIALFGTEFQKAVWLKIAGIPFGGIVTYSQLALSVERPTSARAVANACGANALSIIIPCHRVVACGGTIGGYAGGIETKQWLLRHERSKNELIIGDIKPLSIFISH